MLGMQVTGIWGPGSSRIQLLRWPDVRGVKRLTASQPRSAGLDPQERQPPPRTSARLPIQLACAATSPCASPTSRCALPGASSSTRPTCGRVCGERASPRDQASDSARGFRRQRRALRRGRGGVGASTESRNQPTPTSLSPASSCRTTTRSSSPRSEGASTTSCRSVPRLKPAPQTTPRLQSHNASVHLYIGLHYTLCVSLVSVLNLYHIWLVIFIAIFGNRSRNRSASRPPGKIDHPTRLSNTEARCT